MQIPLSNGTGRERKLVPPITSSPQGDDDLEWLRSGLATLRSEIENAAVRLAQLGSSRAAEKLTPAGKDEFDHALTLAQQCLVDASGSVDDAADGVF
jgi:hypothetical protein